MTARGVLALVLVSVAPAAAQFYAPSYEETRADWNATLDDMPAMAVLEPDERVLAKSIAAALVFTTLCHNPDPPGDAASLARQIAYGEASRFDYADAMFATIGFLALYLPPEQSTGGVCRFAGELAGFIR